MGLLSKAIIIFAVSTFLLGFGIHGILQEIDEAKTFCEDLNKTYDFSWAEQKHYCDDKIISELTIRGYSGIVIDEFWGFVDDYKKKNINITK
jgi:hypothetical protein